MLYHRSCVSIAHQLHIDKRNSEHALCMARSLPKLVSIVSGRLVRPKNDTSRCEPWLSFNLRMSSERSQSDAFEIAVCVSPARDKDLSSATLILQEPRATVTAAENHEYMSRAKSKKLLITRGLRPAAAANQKCRGEIEKDEKLGITPAAQTCVSSETYLERIPGIYHK